MSSRYSCFLIAFIFSLSALAADDIESLIAETGIEEGAVAMRERPNWRQPRKVVVRTEPQVAERLESAIDGIEVVAVGNAAEALREVADADALVGYCSAELLAAGEKLMWVQIFAAGAEDCLAVPDIASGRVLLTNMQKMASPVIGEHAIAMMLSLSRGLTPYAKAMRAGDWDRDLTESLPMMPVEGKTLLVVGLGGIGTEVARRAAALGMRVTATRNSSREGPEFVAYVGLADELTTLAAEADVIVNALPLTPETENLFDDRFFGSVKHGALFINVARGKSVDTEALVKALENGRIAAAGLDVTEPEPLPPEHALWRMENVIITPHVASTGSGTERHMLLLGENLRRFAAGDALLNVVDPARGY